MYLAGPKGAGKGWDSTGAAPSWRGRRVQRMREGLVLPRQGQGMFHCLAPSCNESLQLQTSRSRRWTPRAWSPACPLGASRCSSQGQAVLMRRRCACFCTHVLICVVQIGSLHGAAQARAAALTARVLGKSDVALFLIDGRCGWAEVVGGCRADRGLCRVVQQQVAVEVAPQSWCPLEQVGTGRAA